MHILYYVAYLAMGFASCRFLGLKCAAPYLPTFSLLIPPVLGLSSDKHPSSFAGSPDAPGEVRVCPPVGPLDPVVTLTAFHGLPHLMPSSLEHMLFNCLLGLGACCGLRGILAAHTSFSV